MTAGSFDFPPIDGKAIHQIVDDLVGVIVRVGCQVGVFGGGQDGVVTEDFLYFEQVDAGFDQVGGVTVTKAVRVNRFLSRTRQPPCTGWSARRHDRAHWWRDEPPSGHRGD